MDIRSLLLAAATIVAGDHLRAGDPPAMSTRCTVAAIAGALWPIIVVGLGQLWAIALLVRHRRRPDTPALPTPEPDVVGAGSRWT